MDGFNVSQVRDGDRVVWYDKATGVEIEISGDEPRERLADRVAAHLEALSRQAIHLLEAFI